MRGYAIPIVTTLATMGLAPAAAFASPITHYQATATPTGGANAKFGRQATGGALPHLKANFTLDLSDAGDNLSSGDAKLNYRVRGNGFQDLSDLPGAFHLVHLHSQFASNDRSAPPLQQISGNNSFFKGNGGTPIKSIPSNVPTQSASPIDNNDNYLNFLEEVPGLGPVTLYLGKTEISAPPDGVPPLQNLLNQIKSGKVDPKKYLPDGSSFDYTHTRNFDLTDQDQRRLIANVIGENGDKFADRVIDAHGLTVPTELSDSIDQYLTDHGIPSDSLLRGVDLGNGQSFRVTTPVVTNGNVRAVPTSSITSIALFTAGLVLIGGLAQRRRRPM